MAAKKEEPGKKGSIKREAETEGHGKKGSIKRAPAKKSAAPEVEGHVTRRSVSRRGDDPSIHVR